MLPLPPPVQGVIPPDTSSVPYLSSPPNKENAPLAGGASCTSIPRTTPRGLHSTWSLPSTPPMPPDRRDGDSKSRRMNNIRSRENLHTWVGVLSGLGFSGRASRSYLIVGRSGKVFRRFSFNLRPSLQLGLYGLGNGSPPSGGVADEVQDDAVSVLGVEAPPDTVDLSESVDVRDRPEVGLLPVLFDEVAEVAEGELSEVSGHGLGSFRSAEA